MTDIYLRTADEAAMTAALAMVEGAAIDIIGTITREVDGEPVTLPGWHANVRFLEAPSPELLADLDGVMIDPPVNPYRVWA